MKQAVDQAACEQSRCSVLHHLHGAVRSTSVLRSVLPQFRPKALRLNLIPVVSDDAVAFPIKRNHEVAIVLVRSFAFNPDIASSSGDTKGVIIIFATDNAGMSTVIPFEALHVDAHDLVVDDDFHRILLSAAVRF